MTGLLSSPEMWAALLGAIVGSAGSALVTFQAARQLRDRDESTKTIQLLLSAQLAINRTASIIRAVHGMRSHGEKHGLNEPFEYLLPLANVPEETLSVKTEHLTKIVRKRQLKFVDELMEMYELANSVRSLAIEYKRAREAFDAKYGKGARPGADPEAPMETIMDAREHPEIFSEMARLKSLAGGLLDVCDEGKDHIDRFIERLNRVAGEIEPDAKISLSPIPVEART